MLYGIDISHHNGEMDLAQVRSEGFDFAFFKATEGATFTDPQFKANLDAGRNAGLLVGAYHYQANVTGQNQVDHIASVVPQDVPVLLDVESDSGSERLARDVCDRLRAAGYVCPLLYLPRWYWQQLGEPDLTGLPPLWSSRYPDNRGGYASVIYQRVPEEFWNGYGGLGVEILQFTASATVANATEVDANAYGGAREELAALLSGAPAPGTQ